MKKHAKQHETNVLYNKENFHIVQGLVSSKMNKAPPIGALNAALTPAEAPAAMNYLLF